jgi:hypothetical protein
MSAAQSCRASVSLQSEAEGKSSTGIPYATYRLSLPSHTPFAGAANIEQGITIDLSRLNQVTPSKDLSTVTIGPGNRWANVYLKLDALGIAIGGGRVATVGAGGLTLGGIRFVWTHRRICNIANKLTQAAFRSSRPALVSSVIMSSDMRSVNTTHEPKEHRLTTLPQIVLPSGAIVNATKSSYSDLWLALRGGSNNFGIVTAFESTAFKQGKFW